MSIRRNFRPTNRTSRVFIESLEPRQLYSGESVPTVSLGTDFISSGNVIIDGDVQALGNISAVNKLTVFGSLVAGGSLSTSGTINISGVVSPYAPGLSLPTVDDIRSEATYVIDIQPSPVRRAFDLTSLNFGNGGIIYLRGALNTFIEFKGNVIITGFGTLITDADVTIAPGAVVGGPSNSAQVNLIVGGYLDIDGYLGMTGSLVVNGDIINSGGLNLTGVLVGNKSLEAYGSTLIAHGNPAPFIHYSSSIPEPTSLALLALGTASLLFRRRRPDRSQPRFTLHATK
jgi:hypothetical protein